MTETRFRNLLFVVVVAVTVQPWTVHAAKQQCSSCPHTKENGIVPLRFRSSPDDDNNNNNDSDDAVVHVTCQQFHTLLDSRESSLPNATTAMTLDTARQHQDDNTTVLIEQALSRLTCQDVHILGIVYCGCPVVNDNACRLCEAERMNGNTTNTAFDRTRPLGNDLWTMLRQETMSSNGSNTTINTTTTIRMIPQTCQSYDALLSLTTNSTTPQCQAADPVRQLCGCAGIDNDNDNDNDKEEEEEDDPSSPDNGISSSSPSCTLCPFGESTPFPNRTFWPDPTTTCGGLELKATFVPLQSEQCSSIRGLAKACGCAMPPNICHLCRTADPAAMTKPHAIFSFLRQPQDVPLSTARSSPMTCQVLDSQLAGVAPDTRTCFGLQLRGESCGCTHPESATGLWLKRAGASLSLLGSMYIILDVLGDPKKIATTYHQILLGISVFDAIGSISNWLGPTLAPEYSGIPGAKGNDGTCRALGFAAILGQTSGFFNIGLSFYYWLVICRNVRRRTIRKWSMWIYGLTVLIGLAFAAAGLPYYVYGLHGCHIMPPPTYPNLYPAYVFLVMPLVVITIGTTVFTGLVLWKVRQQEKAMIRYKTTLERSRPGGQHFEWSRRVYRKSLLYLAAVYLTFPFVVVYVTMPANTHFGPLLFIWSAFSPTQGLWNCCVYLLYRKPSSTSYTWKWGAISTYIPTRSIVGSRAGNGRESIALDSRVDDDYHKAHMSYAESVDRTYERSARGNRRRGYASGDALKTLRHQTQADKDKLDSVQSDRDQDDDCVHVLDSNVGSGDDSGGGTIGISGHTGEDEEGWLYSVHYYGDPDESTP